MARLKPWFQVVFPREDLREGRPLDASEFAVHLDHIRAGRAPQDYQQPARFFDRTYLTNNLADLAAQTVRRLSGMAVETSAVFDLATQFGGGKTHALTLLYHLAEAGPAAQGWRGVRDILNRAGLSTIPKADGIAVLVGTEFDAISGRGGDGEPLRRTPWGEVAWQLGGERAYRVVAEHDERGIAPAGDVIRAFLPSGPTLLLFDELMNFISRNRRSGLAAQLYNFLQNLSEEARSRDNLVLAVSIPASELEMTDEDQADYARLKKLLERVGKAMIMSAEADVSEIIRRRLFEWSGMPEDGKRAAAAYADWVLEHREMLGDFDADHAREQFLASYPFHPALLSVFERKWQSLPQFQKTRGVLRLLGLWVSNAYQAGFKGAYADPLIGLGTAPLDDPYFRAALFEQLGSHNIEGPVTTDIAGKPDAHALRLDREAKDAIRKGRLHQKVATAILFESNGGQAREKADATVPEIRLAVGEPSLDIANVEPVLDALTDSCYYLTTDRNRYRFSLTPNLNQVLVDRRANVQPVAIEERMKQEIQTIFKAGPTGIERVWFPERSNQVPNRPVLTLVVVSPDRPLGDPATRPFLEQLVREHGPSGRTFKSALLFAVPEAAHALEQDARNALAWEDIREDLDTVKRLDESQQRQLDTSARKAARDLREAVWRTYKNVLLLGKDNTLKLVDFGLVHSSAATSLVELILNRLRADDEITEAVGPSRLVRYWPPALEAWSTRAARDAFYSSPALPRLLDPQAIKRTIADGVSQNLLAYVGKAADGRYEPFHFETALDPADVEISDEMFVLRAEDARKHKEPPRLASIAVKPSLLRLQPEQAAAFTVECYDQHGRSYPCSEVEWVASAGRIGPDGHFVAETVGAYTVRARADGVEATATVEVVDQRVTEPGTTPLPSEQEKAARGLRWEGVVPPQKWMNFYTKVLTRFVSTPGLTIRVGFEVPGDESLTDAKADDVRIALRELGLSEDVERG